MSLAFKERLQKNLKSRHQELSKALCAGAGENFSEVQHLRGQLMAYETALEALDEAWGVFYEDTIEEESF